MNDNMDYLFEYCTNGNVEGVRRLLDQRINIDQRDRWGIHYYREHVVEIILK